MRISSIKSSKQSFGAFMIEKGNKTPIQREKMKQIAMSPEITQSLIEHLEETGTDLYISASKDKENVNLKLKTAAGMHYSFIPRDEEGPIFSKIKNPKKEENKIMNFLVRAKHFDEDIKHSGQNAERLDMLEKISMDDLSSNNPNMVSCPNLIPDADCYFGTQQVTTKDVLKQREAIMRNTWGEIDENTID